MDRKIKKQLVICLAIFFSKKVVEIFAPQIAVWIPVEIICIWLLIAGTMEVWSQLKTAEGELNDDLTQLLFIHICLLIAISLSFLSWCIKLLSP